MEHRFTLVLHVKNHEKAFSANSSGFDMNNRVKFFLSAVFVLFIALILIGPGLWTLLVWLCNWLDIGEGFVELYQTTFPKTMNPWVAMLWIGLSTLFAIILLLFGVYHFYRKIMHR